ncbi:MAG TPA: NnrU family protein, partial [Amaricoccus sp.]
KGVARTWMRHPMLTAVLIWAVAHLLVNGDRASLVLFGWLGLWAIAEMLLIGAREPAWVRPGPGTTAGTVRWVVISVVLFAVITAIHGWLGYWPFPQ